jgi:putative ABC transport system substrate-binding protein
MNRRTFIGTLTGGLLAAPLAAEAQQSGKVYRIGVLSPFSSSFGPGPSFEAFRHTLHELRYVEGPNIVLEYRWADGRYDRLPDLIAELVRLPVDVIFSAWSTPAALATKKATSTIPIVFAGVGDAVGVGLIASLPGPAATSRVPRSSRRRRSASNLSCSRKWSPASLGSA